MGQILGFAALLLVLWLVLPEVLGSLENLLLALLELALDVIQKINVP